MVRSGCYGTSYHTCTTNCIYVLYYPVHTYVYHGDSHETGPTGVLYKLARDMQMASPDGSCMTPVYTVWRLASYPNTVIGQGADAGSQMIRHVQFAIIRPLQSMRM
jgi:hypothetical protein